MKKEKRIKLILLFASGFSLLYFTVGLNFGNADRFNSLLVVPEVYHEIKDERFPLQESTPPDLFFNDNPLYYDTLSGTYLYSMIQNGKNDYNPLVQVVAKELTRFDIAILGGPFSEETLRANEQIRLLLYTDDTYIEYALSATTLPIISINLNDPLEDIDNPVSQEDEPAQFTLFDNRKDVLHSERQFKSRSYVRLRGASSLRYPQKQFRINLRELSINGNESNHHVPLLGMRSDDDWILYSSYNDPEKMRNTLSNNLWYDFAAYNNPFGFSNGTQGTFVELFVNNMYWGMYTLMHPVDAKQLDLSFSNNPEFSDFHYRTISHLEFIEENFKTAGDQSIVGRFELRDPKKPMNDARKWNPLVKHMSMMTASGGELESYLKEETYVDNLIDYLLFYILTQATDNDTKNHSYIAKYDGNRHIMLESPWDLDLTWGLMWTESHELRATVRGLASQNRYPYVSLIARAIDLDIVEVKSLTEERYDTLRKGDWSDQSLADTLMAYENKVYGSGAILRNKERWPESAYAQNTEEFEQYVQDRVTYMDAFMADLLRGDGINE